MVGAEQTMGQWPLSQWVMGHGSNGSINVKGSPKEWLKNAKCPKFEQ